VLPHWAFACGPRPPSCGASVAPVTRGSFFAGSARSAAAAAGPIAFAPSGSRFCAQAPCTEAPAGGADDANAATHTASGKSDFLIKTNPLEIGVRSIVQNTLLGTCKT